ncbi:unnamed protein product [Urochloa decumbens]|uniref:Knottins-like domain-containing protein n=1 Tax=Urochloa decumbens TaxID=240449 RepID=A0ABC8WD24_9POAL
MAEPSRRNNDLSAAAAAILLFVVVSSVASVGAQTTCRHLSGQYEGWCASDYSCTEMCVAESSLNIRGECHDFPRRCYCVTC